MTLNGTTYKKNQVLICDVIEDEPQFSQILNVYKTPTKTIFVMRDLINVSYRQQNHSYEVAPLSSINVRTHDEFIDYHPIDICLLS